jgi:hypothetical protein
MALRHWQAALLDDKRTAIIDRNSVCAQGELGLRQRQTAVEQQQCCRAESVAGALHRSVSVGRLDLSLTAG